LKFSAEIPVSFNYSVWQNIFLGKSYGFDEKLHLVWVECPTTCGLDIVHLFVDKTTTKCQAICSHKDDLTYKGKH
jgi:hypothetical protein